ncbi:class I SAM-dependent methyltransferase [Szabonella alba]|uniref:Class I SAM-dependent methyltransferase n=1 Tax=Szabonella alba TaxID=2804194 RepID=A0A8K0V4F5_9RHOB|nr:methyltransferase [Szabonella alba]MBL4915639.1 class I SAM-dependent methyltransferase [Szabonella alba]
MRSSRLTLALDGALAALPERGDILILRPRGPEEIVPLPNARLRVVQGFRPEHDALAARGYRCFASAAEEEALPPPVAALVCLPRSKAEARALLYHAARRVVPGGPVWVDGQKTDGIDSVLRDLRGHVTLTETVSKAHGKLFGFAAAADALPAVWQASERQVEGGFVTLPGVFSADGPDAASVMLAAALPDKLNGEVVDLGAGWGYLSRAGLSRNGVRKLHLVEAEAAALASARVNVTDPRAMFHWADATTFRLPRGVDHVLCNPPFHQSREADPGLGLAFLRASARLLAPHGTLWLVANRHLPYDRPLSELFRDCAEIGSDTRFRLTRASRPHRP